MGAYKLSFQARAKLFEIYEYSLLNFGEKKADAYYMALHDAFDRLADMPLMGRQFHEYRRHDHGQYAIFYELITNGIMITEIFHHSEDIDGHLSGSTLP